MIAHCGVGVVASKYQYRYLYLSDIRIGTALHIMQVDLANNVFLLSCDSSILFWWSIARLTT